MTNFSAQLRSLRKQKGLTQEQLATQLHVTRQTISNWENNRAQPDYEMLSVIASLFDVSLAALLGEETAPEEIAQGENAAEETVIQASMPETAPAEDAGKQEAQAVAAAAPEAGQGEAHVFAARRQRQRLLIPIVSLLIGVIVVCVAMRLSAKPVSQKFTPEYFMEAAQPVEGAAQLHIYTRENSARYVQVRPEAEPRWQVSFFMKETGGVGYHIDMMTHVLFEKNGKQHVYAHTEEQIKITAGHPDVEPGEMRMYQFNRPAQREIIGVGIEVQATDENGNARVFTYYQPLEYQPR